MEEEDFYYKLEKQEDGLFRNEDYTKYLRNASDKHLYYFIKLERMILSNMCFPVKVNRTDEEQKITFALAEYVSGKNEYTIKYKDYKPIHLSDPREIIGTHTLLCTKINNIINSFIEEVSGFEELKSIYYPQFYIEEDKLTYIYLYQKLREEGSEVVLAFDRPLYNLIGRFFNCEYALNVDQDDKTNYYIISVIRNEFLTAPLTIIASHSVEDFFYPEKSLVVQVSRDNRPTFTEKDTGFHSNIIYFREDHNIIELNKYILFASWQTMAMEVDIPHTLRLSVETFPIFSPHNECDIIITGKMIIYEDIHDNMSLFNVVPGSLYSETEYNEMTFRKMVNMKADNVHIQNDSVVEQLKMLNAHMGIQFPIMEESSNSNIAYLIKNIYDVLNQTQLIMPMGPTIKPPGHKKIKLDFPVPGP